MYRDVDTDGSSIQCSMRPTKKKYRYLDTIRKIENDLSMIRGERI